MVRFAALPAALLLASLLSAPAAAGAIVIDAFTEPLPPNPCLPSTGQPVIFQGLYCDGATCPPDPFAPCHWGVSAQSGLPGVLATARRDTDIRTFIDGASVVGRVNVAANRFEVVVDESHEQWTEVQYWRFDDPPLALDFIALGVETIAFSMGGDMTLERPVYLMVLLVDSPPAGNGNPAYAEVTVTVPGPISVPLSAFTFSPGFDLRSVDILSLEFGDCMWDDCTPLSGPRAYWLGPISLDANPTPATSASWGGVKSIYR